MAGVTIRRAGVADADAVSALLTANAASRGGELLGEWPVKLVSEWLSTGSVVLVAVRDKRIVGVLFTAEKKGQGHPVVTAMLAAWPGDKDAYVYGPVCVDQASRGQGVLNALYAALLCHMPGREAILFIRHDNPRSLRAHRRLGMEQVATFRLGEQDFLVLHSPGRPMLHNQAAHRISCP